MVRDTARIRLAHSVSRTSRGAPGLAGDRLLPLNRLAEVLPGVYERAIRKYHGRAALLERRIPRLGCLWNDVLHLTPTPPESLALAMRGAGFDWRPRAWFAFDPLHVGFTKENTVILPAPPPPPAEIPEEGCLPFQAKLLAGLTEVPPQTRAHYRRAKQKGRRPLVFAFAPHVLPLGKLSVESAEVIEA